MTRVFFQQELETVATFWRIIRNDGVCLGFTSHNRDLIFDGLLHRASPGMLPSAIRRTAELARESLEVEGILSHDGIRAEDLRQGRFDSSRIKIGVVDWENFDRTILFHGELANINGNGEQFEAELVSAKVALEVDVVPRTSPTCRAVFCDNACQLNSISFSHLAIVASVDLHMNAIALSSAPPPTNLLHGYLRWLDGPHAGLRMDILDSDASGIQLGEQLDAAIPIGTHVLVFEGCDHTLSTCGARFGNAKNFQGEPFLPGNDLLARYSTGSS